MSNNKIIAAVEIGTSKIMVIVGEIVDGQSLNIIGMGECPSEGVRKGEILDYRAASRCTHAAIEEAERSSGTKIEEVYLSQTGKHLQDTFNRGSAQVSSTDHIVSQNDLNRAVADAQSRVVPDDRSLIHYIQNEFALDGRIVETPIGLSGKRLEVGYLSVHGEKRIIADNLRVINGYGTFVKDMIVSSIASGCIVADDSEKKAGVLVVDIGSGTTDYALYRNGYIIKTGLIPIGGDHFTNDICMGMRIDRDQAEKFKIEFGKAIIDKTDLSENIWLRGDLSIGDRSFKRKSIYQILNARTEELFSLLKEELGDLLNPKDLGIGVILTGGGSRLKAIDVVAKEQLGFDVKFGSAPHWVTHNLREPEYSTTLGILHFALTDEHQRIIKTSKQNKFVDKIFDLFKA